MNQTPLRARNAVWISIVWVVALILGAVAPAARAQNNTPVITQLIAAELVTPLNHDAILNDIVVRTDWVYADANQLLVSTTLFDQLIDMEAFARHHMLPATPIVRLRTPEGGEFSFRSDEIIPVEKPDGRADVTVIAAFDPELVIPQANGSWEFVDDYFTAQGAALPETLDLDVLIDLEINSPGNGWIMPLPGEPADYTLPATITLHRGITMVPNTAITANGLGVTLQRLTITPSQTVVDLCWELPDDEPWEPVATLHIGDQAVQLRDEDTTPRSALDDMTRCSRQRYAAYFDGSPAAVTLEVVVLRVTTPNSTAYWDAVRAGLAVYGIEIAVHVTTHAYYGDTVQVINAPEGMTDDEIAQHISREQLIRIPTIGGPWTFTVDVPGAS